MEPVKYLAKFKLQGDAEDIAYRTLTFIWKLSFNAACARITNLIENRYGRWRIVRVEVIKFKVHLDPDPNYPTDEKRTHLWI